MVAKAESVGLLEGFSSSSGGSSIPFIQFVDDILFMLKVNMEMMRNLRCILLILEVASGLKVNLNKTTLSPIGNDPNIDKLDPTLGCTIVSLPIAYLGLLLGARVTSNPFELLL